MPCLNSMAMSGFKQLAICFTDWPVDPGTRTFTGAACAAVDNAREITIEPDLKNSLSDCFCRLLGM